MSLASTFIKGITGFALLTMTVKTGLDYQQLNHQNQIVKGDIKLTQGEYRSQLHKKPRTQIVTSDYQIATQKAKSFLQILYKLHAEKNNMISAKGKALANQANGYYTGNMANAVIPAGVSNWKAKVNYGGEDQDGNVAMAYRYYNVKGQLMSIYTFEYNTGSKKFQSFVPLNSQAGALEVQNVSNKNG